MRSYGFYSPAETGGVHNGKFHEHSGRAEKLLPVLCLEEGGEKRTAYEIPYNPSTGFKAQSNNPDSFSEFPQAAATYAIGGYEGIGIRVSDGIGAFDIDHCIQEDGTSNETAAGVMDAF